MRVLLADPYPIFTEGLRHILNRERDIKCVGIVHDGAEAIRLAKELVPDIVIMDISPEISALTGVTVPISEAVEMPVFAKRSAVSRVGILNGQTIVIGGLMEDRKTENVRKVPLLGDIPILGALFRRTIEEKTKTELLIFLTPHVAQEPGLLKEMTGEEHSGSKLAPNAVEPGAFDEHMRGMRRGMSRDEGP